MVEKKLRVDDDSDRYGGRLQKHPKSKFTYDEIHEITKIDIWFLTNIAVLVEMEMGACDRVK